ncbi:MAG: hypothetical protein ABFR32_13055 [Bacteroidota bacterium]
MKNFFYTLILLLSLTSCDFDDCEGIDCFTPPPSFGFEIVDKQSKENLFTNGTYTDDQIEVFNTQTKEPVEYRFISENNHNTIGIHSIGWSTEKVDITINIGDEVIFNFFVDAERKKGDCCSFTKIKEFRIENIDYEIMETYPQAATILVEN